MLPNHSLAVTAARLPLRTGKRVVAGGDVGVVSEDDRAREHVQRVPFDPLVVVALIKLVTLGRVPEETWTVTHLGPDCVAQGAEAAGAELGPMVTCDADGVGGSSELAEDGRCLLVGPGKRGDSAGGNTLGSAAASKAVLLALSD